MLSQGQELAALDFADIIGGPLIAVINAQAKAAHVTTAFIQNIAFESSGQGGGGQTKLKTVVFDYSQVMGDIGASSGGGSGAQNAMQISVPLLTMIPIPFIRVDSMTIDLNVTLHNTSSTTVSNDFTFSSTASASESAGFIWSESASMVTSVTDRNTYQNDQTVDDTYSLHVTVHAVQDQMPGGMAQVLNIFSGIIQQQASLIQSIMTTAIQAKQKQIQSGGTTGGGGGGGGQ
jgi:hypothetical protein